jgi:hypothetical protein
VTWLPTNFSFKRLSKSTRKSSFWQSPIGFPCRQGMIWHNTLLFKGLAQIACQSVGSQMGSAGYGTPAKRAQRLVEDSGCRLPDTQESGSAGPDWLCLRYCVVR